MFDVEHEKPAATRKRIFDILATDKLAVIGYHMPCTAIGYVEALNGGEYRWLAHSFQLNE